MAKGNDKDNESTPKTMNTPSGKWNTPAPSTFQQQKTQTEYSLPDSDAEQSYATTRFESQNQADGGEKCKKTCKPWATWLNMAT